MSAAVFETLNRGDVVAERELLLTRDGLVRYAGASGDFNPIHHSDHAARAIGLDGVLAHGMLTMGRALRVVTDWAGDPAKVVSYGVRFTRPVPVPDDGVGTVVTVNGRVTRVSDGVATVSIEALCDGAKVLGSSTVEVRVD